MSWIVITAEPSKLRKVRRRLRRKGYAAYLPAISRVRAVAKGNKLKRRRHITPLMSYILVKAPSEHVLDLWLYDITQTKDLRGYLKSGDRPALVPDDMVKGLKATIERSLFEAGAKALRRRLRKGDPAKSKNGAFTNHIGTVLEIRKQLVRWETHLFGRPTVVTMHEDDLEKVEEKAA